MEKERTPLALGVEYPVGVWKPLIPEGSLYPSSESFWMTIPANQDTYDLPFYAGVSPRLAVNHRLGLITLTGWPLSSEDQKIEVEMTVDSLGILSVKAYRREAVTITITADSGLSMDDVARLRQIGYG